ncbi:glycosyltransferase family 2 protein [Candidatus Pelagibacter sp. Uisw_136]|uniref:glycosyltransferase family 2 protein n=1 Tax=Candidatus Pelagibacter sp. Uisw_136 TaxID=3230991 RepID=UPI0039E8406D
MNKKISIVTPTFNEEANISRLCDEISKEMQGFSYDYEHIIIDNYSTDKTVSIIKEIARMDKRVKIILNSRNFGHIRSSQYGLLQSSGDATILLSSDFQEPTNLIGKYLKEWENGHKIILGQRASTDSNQSMNFIKSVFYKFMNMISEMPLIERSGSTGLLSKEIVDHLRVIGDPYPYFRGLLSEISSDIKTIQYHQIKRMGGKTKNNFYTLYDMAILGVIKHSKVPLRIVTFVGVLASLVSILIAFIFLIYKILFWNSFEVGIAPLIIGLFSIVSIQTFLLGFIGEYLIQILTHSRNLPLVIEKERINF